MSLIFKPRSWCLLVVLACAGLLGYALYVQHALFVDPCPLCVFQRIGFMWIGGVALLALLHNPGAIGRRVYAVGMILGGLGGMMVAGRHLWLQSLPADQVPDCGMGLNYMLETMPFTEVLTTVFYGSGECAEVHWTFLGLSMPGWTFFWYLLITAGTMLILFKASSARA